MVNKRFLEQIPFAFKRQRVKMLAKTRRQSQFCEHARAEAAPEQIPFACKAPTGEDARENKELEPIP
jgi:hypothetical protein